MDELMKIINRHTEEDCLISETVKEEMAKDILALLGTVGRSEQLLAFAQYLDEVHGGEEFAVNEIDNFLKSQ